MGNDSEISSNSGGILSASTLDALKPDSVFIALVLIQSAYKEGLINRKTYQAVLKKYGGDYCNGLHD